MTDTGQNKTARWLKTAFYSSLQPCADQEGGQGVQTPPPLKNKNIGLLSNTGPDPLKNHKATKPVFNAGPTSARQQNAI